MSMPKGTRAYFAGISAGRLSNKAVRFSNQTRERVRLIAYEWDEVCSFVDRAATELERELDRFDQAIKEAVEYINQPPEES